MANRSENFMSWPPDYFEGLKFLENIHVKYLPRLLFYMLNRRLSYSLLGCVLHVAKNEKLRNSKTKCQIFVNILCTNIAHLISLMNIISKEACLRFCI